jgi:hypothetical protein
LKILRIGRAVLPIVLLIGLVFSCIEPYEISYNLTKSVVIVDAVITDETEEQNIVIKESTPNGSTSSIVPMQKAQVEILVNGKEKILFTERPTDPGTYLAPSGFKAQLGNDYQLVIVSAGGDRFESTIERVVKGGEVKAVRQTFENVINKEKKTSSFQHRIFVDTEDPSTLGNNYSWSYRLFESQPICKTCEPGQRYYLTPAPNGRCVSDLPNFLRNVVYDYQCSSSCWEIVHSLKANIMSDELVNGKIIENRLVAEVPLYSLNAGALIEIKQQSLSPNGYRYLKILIDQNQNSGGLADTPPAALIGNIKGLGTDSRPIAGFFRVTDQSTIRYWIDRTGVVGENAKPVGLLGGRASNYEPQGADTTRPPLAPCQNGYTRTNQRPLGWVDSK